MSMFDGILLVLFLIFVGFGFVRGLVRAFSGILGGFLAIAGTFFLLPLVYPLLEPYLGEELWVFVVTACLFFLIFLLFAFFLGDLLVKAVRAGPLRFVDSFFGAIWGGFKGALFFCLVYWGLMAAAPDLRHQHKLDESIVCPWLDKGVLFLKEDVPEFLQSLSFVYFLQDHFQLFGDGLKPTDHQKLALYEDEVLSGGMKVVPYQTNSVGRATATDLRVV